MTTTKLIQKKKNNHREKSNVRDLKTKKEN